MIITVEDELYDNAAINFIYEKDFIEWATNELSEHCPSKFHPHEIYSFDTLDEGLCWIGYKTRRRNY